MKRNLILPLLAVVLIAAHIATAKSPPLPSLPRRPYLGCQIQAVPDSLRRSCPVPFEGGVLLGEIRPGGTAEKAALHKGDILLTIGGAKVADPASLGAVLKKQHSGERVRIEWIRDGKRMSARVRLIPYPKETGDGYDVLYESVPVGNVLRRMIVTRPKAAGRYPVILLIGGIGCYSLDLAPGTPHPYNTLISDLAKRGYVTVRVEKTGMGDSEGPPCEESDFETELNGYRAALKSLGSYPFMDTTRVILLGHSMGGIIAPLLFPEYPVKGIIAMATCGTSWLEYELVNTRRQLLLEGMAADSLEDRMRTKELALHELLVNQRAPEDILKDHPELGEDLQYPCHYTYIQQVAARNVMEDWRRVNVPVLLLWGRGDFVTAREDHTYLSDAINRDHPALATYSEIEKMDHFLCKIGSERESWDNLEAGRPNREFCDDVIPEILRWTQTVLAGR